MPVYLWDRCAKKGGTAVIIAPWDFCVLRGVFVWVVIMELKVRKSLRLENFDYSRNGAYFITICTKDKSELFWCGSSNVGVDAHIDPPEISEYGKVADKYINNIKELNRYVIMPNHIHMILILDNGTMWASSPTQQTVSQIVKSFKTLVTKELGFSLWQRSFHDHIIRNEKEYIVLSKYIDNNPVNWQNDCLFLK